MYQSILVPLDGTWFGEHALPLARGLARRFGATLHLVHVHTEGVVPVAVESLPYVGALVPIGSTGDEQGYLDEVGARVAAGGVRVSTGLVRGPLMEALERYALEHGVDLVIACTHCHEGVSRLWHRGVGETLLHGVSIPILLIRADDTRPDPGEERTVRHILVPLDGSAFAEAVLDEAIPLARGFGARITLLRVVRPILMTGYTLLGQDAHLNHFLLDDQQQEALAYLERTAERLRAAGMEVRTRVVTHEQPAAAVVEATRPDRADPAVDLIAMTTHCRGPFTRAVLSSVSDGVLHDSPVPLLLHHPRPAGEAEPAAERHASALGR